MRFSSRGQNRTQMKSVKDVLEGVVFRQRIWGGVKQWRVKDQSETKALEL